ncbi:MAG: polysaccharide deacetylase family protein [Clostridia bacterium]|nr:polysaccharide deacetylase family protein [Clostridia bacterium]
MHKSFNARSLIGIICLFSLLLSPALAEMEQIADRPVEFAALSPDAVYPEPIEGFLPVCHSRRTGEKLVAITIDDCNQPGNLQKMINIISEFGGKATIFPIGENVSFLGDILREAVSLGFEIENHTQSHSGLYYEDDEGLAYQIWQQNYEVSMALGVDYQMHFLRPRGGDNRYDQRTHAYMRQMGYSAIAYWSQVGSDNTARNLMKNLTPGDIILFHTTDGDLETIEDLVPKLHAAGYRMVTLNELYGLPENEQRELSGRTSPIPLGEHARFAQTLKYGDYLHDVFLMQARLSELGYISDNFNGYFGEYTEKALRSFQTDNGLEASGVCTTATWRALFGE